MHIQTNLLVVKTTITDLIYDANAACIFFSFQLKVGAAFTTDCCQDSSGGSRIFE